MESSSSNTLLLTPNLEEMRQENTQVQRGGDEFAVVLKSVRAIEDAQSVGESLLQSLATPFEIEEQEITIGASIGIAVFPDHAEDESALLQFADSAMYGAKRAGKNRLMVFDKELGDFARERVAIENQLRCDLTRMGRVFGQRALPNLMTAL